MILYHEHLRGTLNILILLTNIVTANNRWQKDYKLLKSYLCKLLLDLCLTVAIISTYFLFQTETYPHVALLNFTSMWSLVAYSNGVLAVCYFVAHLYRLINLQVNECMDKLSVFEKDQLYWTTHPLKKKQICCMVAAELNKLAYLHQDVATIMRTIVKTLDCSLLIAILYTFLVTTGGIFYTYTSLMLDIRSNRDLPKWKYCYSLLLASFQALQFYYLVSGSTLLTRRAQKTGIVVNRFFKADIDEQVERTINMFSMGLLHHSYSIESFGMFKVDFTLMYSVGN
ncbi:uncharacterized protein LOC129729259 [Wyeomyia smithii]|uniref:uncharacterized protein LOC129729259 n=1 Tax=Wyeomyia smithii TaxID=174621 RepID=UPI002467DA05|nr:uncharacterized protein LOC129729259 [Wyeomyia smithii]